MDAQLNVDGADVAGFYYEPNGQFIGTFGSDSAGPPTRPYDPSHPGVGGWDGVGLRYVPAHVPGDFGGSFTARRR